MIYACLQKVGYIYTLQFLQYDYGFYVKLSQIGG